jgi:hypothetical protein
MHVDPSHRSRIASIGEGDVLQIHGPFDARHLHRPRSVGHVRRRIQQLEDAFAPRHGGLECGVQLAELQDGLEEPADVGQ